ncbi:MAG: CPBP family intramembrane metalloprotease [Pirellulaceae bacterium]|nr:CPBP family intramembrane metalloprotease [Pirellulaceae bacterium]
MPNAHPLVELLANWLVLFVMAAGLLIWYKVAQKLVRGERVLRVEPRRQVPWTGLDVLMVLLFYFVCNVLVATLGFYLLGPEITRAPVIDDPKDAEAGHLIIRLLLESDRSTIFACVLSAAVVAPITEEILFRLFLQGWFEKVDRDVRQWVPALARWVRWGTVPVVLTSLLFASVHFRGEVRQYDPLFLVYLLMGSSIVKMAATAMALGVAVVFRGARAADLGWEAKQFSEDVVLGLTALAAVIVPMFASMLLLNHILPKISILPKHVAPDPLPLFFFSLVLGMLYLRTHRITSAIVAHMGLNASSLLLLWLATG